MIEDNKSRSELLAEITALRKRVAKLKDVEQQHETAEQNYQMLFQKMLDGFAVHEIICDDQNKPINYRFLNVNPAFEQMTTLKGKDIIGKTVMDIMPGIESYWIETYGKVALTGEPVFFENYSEDLGKHFQVTAFQPIPGQFATIFVDVTERILTKEKLEKLNKNLLEKNSELEQVVYVASHDLRSPLVNIDGYARELEMGIQELKQILNDSITSNLPEQAMTLMDGDIPESLKYIRSSAFKMDTLLTGLLRLSRSGRASLAIVDLDMNQLLQQVIESTGFRIETEAVKVDVAELPSCRGDAVQVNQVFSNLLSNALKYLDPSRPGHIKVTGKLQDETVVYCVEDNGIGIAELHQKNIFEIFHRLDPSSGEGEGLGLTIVEKILDRLEGKTWVESELGVGSQFYVALPARSEE